MRHLQSSGSRRNATARRLLARDARAAGDGRVHELERRRPDGDAGHLMAPTGSDAAIARDRLLLAAAELLDAADGSEVSTRAICDRAGVQAPTLYHHFGSKQGLLDEESPGA